MLADVHADQTPATTVSLKGFVMISGFKQSSQTFQIKQIKWLDNKGLESLLQVAKTYKK